MIRMDNVLKSGVCTALLCLALGCSSSTKKEDENNSKQPKKMAVKKNNNARLYQDALAMEAEGNYADAFARYKEIEVVDPDFMDVANRLENYRDLVDMQQEIALLQDESPAQQSIYRVEFASLLRKRGADYRDQSRAQYMKAVELDAANFDAHYGLGSLYLEASYQEKAIEHFELAAAADSNQYSKKSDAYFQLAFLYRTYEPKKDAMKAEENAKLAVDYSAGEALEKRRLYSELLMSNGKKDEAVKVAEEIVAREGSTDGDKARVARFNEGKTQESMMPAEPMKKDMDGDKKMMDGDKKMDAPAEPMNKDMDGDKKMMDGDKKMDAPAEPMNKDMDGDKKMMDGDKKMDKPASQPANN